jgi:hypothetical protein
MQKAAVSLNETVERLLAELRATRFPKIPVPIIAGQLDEDATSQRCFLPVPVAREQCC